MKGNKFMASIGGLLIQNPRMTKDTRHTFGVYLRCDGQLFYTYEDALRHALDNDVDTIEWETWEASSKSPFGNKGSIYVGFTPATFGWEGAQANAFNHMLDTIQSQQMKHKSLNKS